MQKPVLLFGKPGALEELRKSHIAGYTRKDGTFVQEHDDKRQAAAPESPTSRASKLGQVHDVVSPNGRLPGQHVMVPHPDNPSKKVLGHYIGQSDGKAIVHHKEHGNLLVHNDHVGPARGIPKQHPSAMVKVSQDWHAKHGAAASEGSGPEAPKRKPRAAKAEKPTVRTENEGYGFHGAAYHSVRREKFGADGDVPNGHGKAVNEETDKAFSRVANELVDHGHFDKHEHARDFLDSTYGRHLGNEIGHKGSVKDVSWLPRSVSKFKASMS